jgi:hypothetical protein
MIEVEELTRRRGGRAVIGLRDTLAAEARVTRVRQLATPSWLSSRTTS